MSYDKPINKRNNKLIQIRSITRPTDTENTFSPAGYFNTFMYILPYMPANVRDSELQENLINKIKTAVPKCGEWLRRRTEIKAFWRAAVKGGSTGFLASGIIKNRSRDETALIDIDEAAAASSCFTTTLSTLPLFPALPLPPCIKFRGTVRLKSMSPPTPYILYSDITYYTTSWNHHLIFRFQYFHDDETTKIYAANRNTKTFDVFFHFFWSQCKKVKDKIVATILSVLRNVTRASSNTDIN